MRDFGKALLKGIKRVDLILFITVAFLSMTSILTILGSVENFGKSKLVMQLAMTAVGTVIVFVMANLDYKFIVDRFYIYMFGASVLLLVLTLILGNTGVNMDTANKSWIKIPFIGISVQPSVVIHDVVPDAVKKLRHRRSPVDVVGKDAKRRIELFPIVTIDLNGLQFQVR